ncbi:unnamed protein product [Caenorhabditis auriculariae]|uniref:Uncharacterized protein n=1 Tax=Caenorhabditis auriculariae TaxID=2777116 RepID=A0A8S1H1E3_9PELO|nr:unnamed protein product [Caenorhabditis auriculariae]
MYEIVDFESRPTENELKVAWPYPNSKRTVEGGCDDKLIENKLTDLSENSLGTDGVFRARIDQKTLLFSKEIEFIVYFQKESENFEMVVVPQSKAILIQPGFLFAVDKNELVKTLNRQTNGIVSERDQLDKTKEVKEVAGINASFVKETISLADEDSLNDHNLIDLEKTDEKSEFIITKKQLKILASTEESQVGVLRNTFTMEWEDHPSGKQVLFTGTGGALTEGKGNPGVVFDPNSNEVQVNLLLKRPDGTFFISSKSPFIMLVAESDKDGEPDRSTLKAIKFTDGVQLKADTWHSVPFPLPDGSSIDLIEKVAETNANIVINVNEEAGSPMRVQL